MTCHEARELFSGWADEALTADERAHVSTHLAGCADCRKELERFSATVALLNRMERPHAPVGFVDRVLAARRAAPWYERIFQRLFLPVAVKLPAEVAALLLVAGLAAHIFQHTPELQSIARHERAQQSAPHVNRPGPSASIPVSPVAPARGAAGEPESQVGARQKTEEASKNTGRLAFDQFGMAQRQLSPPGPAPSPGPSVQPSTELKKEAEERAPSTPSSTPREDTARPAPPVSGTATAPGAESRADVSQRARTQESAAAQALVQRPLQSGAGPGVEPPGGPATPQSGRLPAPAARSAMRALPSADVVGRLAVKDRDAAEQALGDMLQRAGGAVISRRVETGTTVVEVTVPKAAYPQFSEGLARIGVWKADGVASDLPSDVHITVHLVE